MILPAANNGPSRRRGCRLHWDGERGIIDVLVVLHSDGEEIGSSNWRGNVRNLPSNPKISELSRSDEVTRDNPKG